MKGSTIWDNRIVRICVTALFWLAVWQAGAVALPRLLFAGPVPTVQSLFLLLASELFWRSVAHSLAKIALGFVLAFVAGGLLTVLCARKAVLRMLFEPVIQLMKSLPVACFVVVALIWVGSAQISVLTAFFVVFPVVYINVGEGLRRTDRGMLEMARLFRLSASKRLRAVWLPSCMPYLLSACRVTVGMALKAGVAGEIIGLPRWSIGEQLYLAKLYLNTADLFAWSLAIIGISLLLEKLLVAALGALGKKWGCAA